jgi:hypothetical protein
MRCHTRTKAIGGRGARWATRVRVGPLFFSSSYLIPSSFLFLAAFFRRNKRDASEVCKQLSKQFLKHLANSRVLVLILNKKKGRESFT